MHIEKYKILIILTLSAIFFSCEKIVDLDLNPNKPRNVIDASITANQPCIVILSQSQDFNNNNSYKYISGAVIELKDNLGNKEVLRESQNEAGVYFSLTRGVTNRTYTLRVSIDSEEYESTATIPNAVPIDSIYIYDLKIGDEHMYSPCVIFDDPEDEENYYYSIMHVNRKLMRSFYLDDDKHRNGVKGVENILFFDKEDNGDEKLKAGDHIRVEMQTLDKGMYTFYETLSSVVEGTNPTTNIKGGALGCFKAYNSSIIEMTITEEDIP